MKNIFVRLFVIAMILPGLVYAQVPIVPASTMQRAVSGMMQSKFTQRGFASNDPRWGATLESAGATIVGAAAAAAVVTAAGITAPAWVTVGATVALATLFAAGINLAVDGIKWVFNSDGSITTTVTGTEPSQKGSETYSLTTITGNVVLGGNANAVAMQYAADFQSQNSTNPPILYYVEGCTQYANGTMSFCVLSYSQAGYPDTHNFKNIEMLRNQNLAYSCDGLTVNGVCNPPKATASIPVTLSPSVAADSIGLADRAKPVNPAILAAIADQAWKQAAAKPGYSGLPYDAANPITQADAVTYRASHSTDWPTVGDAVAPQAKPSGATSASPFELPNSAAKPAIDTSTTPPVTTPPSGIDWAIPATSDTIPKQVAAVTYTPTVFASPTGCPAPVSFFMYGKQYAIAYQPACDLMTTVAPIFLAIGAAGAALIFASALKS